MGVVGSGGVCSVKPPTKWFPCSELFEFQISSLFGNRSYLQLQRKLTNGFHPEGEEEGLGQKLSSMESLFNGSACHPPSASSISVHSSSICGLFSCISTMSLIIKPHLQVITLNLLPLTTGWCIGGGGGGAS